MFTRQHYQKVAEFIKDESVIHTSETEVDYLYDCMVRLFKKDNPRFKEHLFNRAAGRNDY